MGSPQPILRARHFHLITVDLTRLVHNQLNCIRPMEGGMGGGMGRDVSYYLPKLQELSAINVAMTRV